MVYNKTLASRREVITGIWHDAAKLLLPTNSHQRGKENSECKQCRTIEQVIEFIMGLVSADELPEVTNLC